MTARTAGGAGTAGTLRVGGFDLRVRVEHAGAGRPLLLVNGIGATGDLFDTFRGHLADRETISFDAPGVGGSSTPHYPPTLRRLAGVVAELVGAVGHERVDVLGLSWGGALVQELARGTRTSSGGWCWPAPPRAGCRCPAGPRRSASWPRRCATTPRAT